MVYKIFIQCNLRSVRQKLNGVNKCQNFEVRILSHFQLEEGASLRVGLIYVVHTRETHFNVRLFPFARHLNFSMLAFCMMPLSKLLAIISSH